MSDKLLSVLADTVMLNPQAGVFGVEIECEGDNLPAAVYGWQVHKEGSLRGEAKEYVTDGAVTMQQLSKRLDLLNHTLKANDGNVNQQCFRASTHVHVNCQRLTYREIFSAIMVFQMVEPIFMRLCGPSRDGNLFCLPSYDCGDMPRWISEAVECIDFGGTIRRARERGKYAGLNTNNLAKIGTLEFRTFPCSIDKDKVMSWAHWCQQVVLAGKSFADMNQRQMVTEFFQEPVFLLTDIFGVSALDDFAEYDILNMVQIGAENAFETARAYERTIKILAAKRAKAAA